MIKTQVNGLTEQAFAYLMERVESETGQRFFQKYFPMQTTDRLTYEAIQDIVGKNIAAFVTMFGAEASELGYEEVVTLQGKIKPISIKRILNEEDLISMKSQLAASMQRVREKLYNNLLITNNGVLSRLDFYAMQLLSNQGVISLTANTNAGHIVETIDYKLESWQKETAGTLWSVSATADPIANIKAWVKTRRSKGYNTTKVLMDDTVFAAMAACTKVAAETTYAVGSTAVKGNIVTLDAINVVLKGARLPIIEIVEDNINYIKADGTIDTTARAWNSNNITLIGSDNQGMTLNAPTAEFETESLKKIALVSQVNGVTMQQYGVQDPPQDVTKAKANAMVAWGRSAEVLTAKVL